MTKTPSNTVVPKTVWHCSPAPVPESPESPESEAICNERAKVIWPTVDQSQVQESWRLFFRKEGSSSVGIEKPVPLIPFPYAFMYLKPQSPLKYWVMRRAGFALPSSQGASRHELAYFSSFEQLDPLAERKQSLSKSQLSLCLFRKISIKDKANFN